MTLSFPFRFAVVIFREDGSSLGTVPIQRDWEPVHEWTRFYFQRKGELALDGNASASVLPLWEQKQGEPYCRGFRVQIEQPDRQPVAFDFPMTHFRDCASAIASRFVAQNQLREGEYFSYQVVAHPAPQGAADVRRAHGSKCVSGFAGPGCRARDFPRQGKPKRRTAERRYAGLRFAPCAR